MEIRSVDAADPDQLAAFHATYLAASVFGRAYPTPWKLEEMRADLLGERPGERVQAFAGYDGDQVVTTGALALPLKDNLSLAGFELFTHPDHRRRGHGSAMLDHLTGLAGQADRTTMMTHVSLPYEGPVDGHGHPDAEFAYRRGFTFSLGDVMRVLDIPVDAAVLDRLAEEARPHHAGYALRQFRGPVPEDIVEAYGALAGSLMTEAPMGELQLENAVLDEERIRADEAILAASGRTRYTTVAVAEDGTVAAYSEIMVPSHERGRTYQWGTLVAKEHRGHRLGMATKVANLAWLQREEPDRTAVVTFNAEVNAHMVGVNEAMGFRPVERLGEFMRVL
jgi:GNAT superfamily N-acetyltransferase